MIEPMQLPPAVQELMGRLQAEIAKVMTPPIWYGHLSPREKSEWYNRAVLATEPMRREIAKIIRLVSLTAPMGVVFQSEPSGGK